MDAMFKHGDFDLVTIFGKEILLVTVIKNSLSMEGDLIYFPLSDGR